MPLNTNGLNTAAAAIKSTYLYAQTHYEDPGAADTANVNAGARISIPWADPVSGNLNLSGPLNFTGIAANNDVKYITIWTATSSGSCGGSFATSGDQSANSVGEYSVSSLPLNGTAS